MFELCNDLSQLNAERIAAIKSGNPSVIVNKEYARRRAVLLSTQERTFKRIPFYPVAIPTLPMIVAMPNVYWEDEDPYRMIIIEE